MSWHVCYLKCIDKITRIFPGCHSQWVAYNTKIWTWESFSVIAVSHNMLCLIQMPPAAQKPPVLLFPEDLKIQDTQQLYFLLTYFPILPYWLIMLCLPSCLPPLLLLPIILCACTFLSNCWQQESFAANSDFCLIFLPFCCCYFVDCMYHKYISIPSSFQNISMLQLLWNVFKLDWIYFGNILSHLTQYQMYTFI